MAFDSFRVSREVADLLPAVQLASFSDSERQYYQLSQRNVAYSVRIDPLVIADYAADGSVRGIEFVGKREGPIEVYLTKALAASRGPSPAGSTQYALTISNVTINNSQPGDHSGGHMRKDDIKSGGGSGGNSGGGSGSNHGHAVLKTVLFP